MPFIRRPYVQRILPATLVAGFVSMYIGFRFQTLLPMVIPALGIILVNIYGLVEKGRLEEMTWKEPYVQIFRKYINITMLPFVAAMFISIHLIPIVSHILMVFFTAYAVWGTATLFKQLDSIDVDTN